jgi:hypothetical protein
MSDLDQTLEILRSAGEVLVPFNSVPRYEDAISTLKRLTCVVDGYSCIIYFHKVAYENRFIEILQITGINNIYLPFNVVIKIACKGLGGHHLSYVPFYRDNIKIYCWSVLVDDRGRPLPNPFEKEKTEDCVYNGIEYSELDPKQLNIY